MAKGRPLKFPDAKRKILAAASDLFYRHGVNAVGVNEISDAAGVTKPTLYRHYRSKDGLVEAWLAADAKRVLDAMRKVFANIADRPQTVRTLQNVFGAEGLDGAGRGLFLINVAVEYPEANHPVRQIAQATVEDLRARLVELLSPLTKDVDQVDAVANHILLLVLGASSACQTFGCAEAAETLATSIGAVLHANARALAVA